WHSKRNCPTPRPVSRHRNRFLIACQLRNINRNEVWKIIALACPRADRLISKQITADTRVVQQPVSIQQRTCCDPQRRVHRQPTIGPSPGKSGDSDGRNLLWSVLEIPFVALLQIVSSRVCRIRVHHLGSLLRISSSSVIPTSRA